MPAATNTVEDLEAANTLLSLGDSLEDTLEEDDDNALLMPIGGANNLEDIAPEPIRLDRHSVDNTIAELIDSEELKKSTEEEGMNPKGTLPAPTDQLQLSTEPPPVAQPPDISANAKKGSLITKHMCSRNMQSNGHSNVVNAIRLNKPSKNLISTTEKSTTHRCVESAIEHSNWLQV